MNAQLSRLVIAGLMTTGLAVTVPATAQAATPGSAQCAVVNSQTLGGFTWRVMPTARVCSNSLSAGVSGTSYLAKRSITVNYSASHTSTTEVAKATVHELAHNVEYRTTAAHRAKLYSFLGFSNPSGNYFAVDDARYYSGPLSLWKASPRERLAESVVNCTYGAPNHSGMSLVPKARCSAFLSEFKSSLAVSR